MASPVLVHWGYCSLARSHDVVVAHLYLCLKLVSKRPVLWGCSLQIHYIQCPIFPAFAPHHSPIWAMSQYQAHPYTLTCTGTAWWLTLIIATRRFLACRAALSWGWAWACGRYSGAGGGHLPVQGWPWSTAARGSYPPCWVQRLPGWRETRTGHRGRHLAWKPPCSLAQRCWVSSGSAAENIHICIVFKDCKLYVS